MNVPKPNFKEMTTKQLRNYILQHRDDEDAIHAMAVRLREQGETLEVDEFIEVVKHRVQQNQQM
jgi:hypothetical protein